MIRNITYLTLSRLAKLQNKGNIEILCKQLSQLYCPERLRIGFRTYAVPQSLDDFRENICWGQRLFMGSSQNTDWESFLFFLAGYYQPIVTKHKYDETEAVRFYDMIAKCHAFEAYPVLTRFVKYFEDLVRLENDKLNQPPDRDMRAAEVDKLRPFTDLNILELVSEKCRVPLKEAHLIEYDIVFALLWAEKETIAFQRRYNEVLIAKNKSK